MPDKIYNAKHSKHIHKHIYKFTHKHGNYTPTPRRPYAHTQTYTRTGQADRDICIQVQNYTLLIIHQIKISYMHAHI